MTKQSFSKILFLLALVVCAALLLSTTCCLAACHKKVTPPADQPSEEPMDEEKEFVSGDITVQYYVFGELAHSETVDASKRVFSFWTPDEIENYVFRGWFKDELGEEEATKAYIYDRYYGREKQLYAKYEYKSETVDVRFVYNGNLFHTESVVRGESLARIYVEESLLETHRFLGWCYDSTLTSVYMVGDALYEDTTLYGKFVPLDTTSTVIVSYDVNGGESVPNVALQQGAVIDSLPTPHRAGYMFIGWFADNAARYPYPTGNENGDAVVSNLQLIASWAEIKETFSITFHTQTEQVIEPIVCFYDKMVENSALPLPSLFDDEFLGWYLDPQLNAPYTSRRITQALDLYAKWKERESIDDVRYIVRYEYFVDEDDTLRYGTLEWPINSTEYLFTPQECPANTDFVGWFADSDRSTPYVMTPLRGDVTVYAKYEERVENRDGSFYYQLGEDGTYYIASQYIGSSASVVIPQSFRDLPVTEIGAECFRNVGIEQVTIGDNVIAIGADAFYNTLPSSITIPRTVTSIGSWAFSNMPYLSSVTIEGDPSLGYGVFRDNDGLLSVTASSLTNIATATFTGCDNLVSVQLGKLTALEEGAFEDCVALSSVRFASDSTFKAVGAGAFENTRSLTSLSLPASVATIADSAFCGSGITSLLLDGVRVIASNAFVDCLQLTSLTLGQYVSHIDSQAFMNCPSMQSIVVAPVNPTYTTVDGVLFDKSKTTLLYFPAGRSAARYEVPSGVTEISILAFAYATDVGELVIPASVEIINSGAFLRSRFASITVEEGNSHYKSDAEGNLISLDGKILYYCVACEDTYVVQYETVSSFAFSGTTIKTLIFAESVHNISSAAVGFDESITAIVVYGAPTIAERAFYQLSALGSLTTVQTYSEDILFECPRCHYPAVNED